MVDARSTAPRSLPPNLVVRAWSDQLLDRTGFVPDSEYVEYCWLGVLGPTATWLYRYLGRMVQPPTNELGVDTEDLALSLGLGHGLAANSPLARSIGRLAHFGLAAWTHNHQLAVRRRVSPLSVFQLDRLSRSAVAMHLILTGELLDD